MPIKRKIKIGDIFEIPLGNMQNGYAWTLRNDNFGLLLKLFKEIYPDDINVNLEILTLKEFCYVNPYSIKMWVTVDNQNPLEELKNIPIMFYGSPNTVWTVVHPDGELEYFKVSEISHDDLLEKGYMNKVLWLGNDIVTSLTKNIQLHWENLNKFKNK